MKGSPPELDKSTINVLKSISKIHRDILTLECYSKLDPMHCALVCVPHYCFDIFTFESKTFVLANSYHHRCHHHRSLSSMVVIIMFIIIMVTSTLPQCRCHCWEVCLCRPTSPPAFHQIATPLNITFGHNGIQNDDDDDFDDDDDDEKATYGKLLVYIHALCLMVRCS